MSKNSTQGITLTPTQVVSIPLDKILEDYGITGEIESAIASAVTNELKLWVNK